MRTAEEQRQAWFDEAMSKIEESDASNLLAQYFIDFAKMHVKAALDELYEQCKHGDEEHQKWLKDKFNAYSLENIK